MKHLLVTLLALILGVFVGLGLSYTTDDPDVAPTLRTDGPPTSQAPDEPVMVYTGNISEADKSELTRLVIQPFVVYHQTQKDPVVSVKVSVANNPGYRFSIDYIQYSGSYGGWLENIDTVWYPTCLGPCPMTDNYIKLYPEVAKMAGVI